MSTEVFYWVVTVGVFLAALSMVVQAGIVIALYMTSKKMMTKVEPLIPRAHALMDTAQTTLDQSKQHIVDVTVKAHEIANKASDMMDTAKSEFNIAKDRLNEMLEGAKAELNTAKGRADELMQVATMELNVTRDRFHGMLDTMEGQLTKVDELVSDATGRAKVQMDRAEMVIDDTVTRVHETVGAVHNGIMRPVREIGGMVTGVKTAFNHLLNGRRPSVNQVTQDEEMFI